MKTYVARVECLVEVKFRACSYDEALARVAEMDCDELTILPKTVAEVYEFYELEEVLDERG